MASTSRGRGIFWKLALGGAACFFVWACVVYNESLTEKDWTQPQYTEYLEASPAPSEASTNYWTPGQPFDAGMDVPNPTGKVQ